MIESDVAICNQALYLIGADRIDTLSEGSPQSKACLQFYTPTKDEVLSEHTWNCAVWRVQLADLAGTYYTNWKYQFQLPEDPYCLRVLALLDFINSTYAELPHEPYEVEGRVLLCNLSAVGIRYIGRILENQMSSWVAETLVYKLAAKISTKIGNKKPTDMYQAYMVQWQRAIQLDGMNRKNRDKPRTSLDSWVDDYA